MSSGESPKGVSVSATVRTAIKSLLVRRDERTIIEECRRCGTTIDAGWTTCPSCECDDIVEYRIR